MPGVAETIKRSENEGCDLILKTNVNEENDEANIIRRVLLAVLVVQDEDGGKQRGADREDVGSDEGGSRKEARSGPSAKELATLMRNLGTRQRDTLSGQGGGTGAIVNTIRSTGCRGKEDIKEVEDDGLGDDGGLSVVTTKRARKTLNPKP